MHVSRAFVFAACGGCSLLTDLSGFSGAADVRDPLADAAAEAGDAAVSGEAGPGDSGTGDGALPRFCATHPGHTVCEDFDDGVLPSDWLMTATGPGRVAWSSARAQSAPGSLLTTLPRRATNKENAVLSRVFMGPFRRVVVEADLFVELPDWQAGDVNAGIIAISTFSATVNSGLALSAGMGYVTIGLPGGVFAQAGQPLPFGQWFHLKVDYDPVGGSASVQVGPIVLTKAFTPTPGGASPETVVDLGVLGYNAPAPIFTTYVDNVLVDLP